MGKNRKGRTRIQRRISVTESPPERHGVHTELGVLRVGLACAMKKPVWVYEQWRAPVHFPVPYLTDYVLYDPT